MKKIFGAKYVEKKGKVKKKMHFTFDLSMMAK